MEKVQFYIPTREYNPIDSLNRRAAAMGSPRYAMGASSADYNGHHVTLDWNAFNQYYVAKHWWAGPVWHGRGAFASCLRAVISEYNRGALGATASIVPREDDTEAVELCRSTPLLIEGKESWPPPWYTWRHSEAAGCARDMANPGRAVKIFDWELMQAANSAEEYDNLLKEKYKQIYR